MNSHFEGCWLEWGPPSLSPRHSGGLHLLWGQAGRQARQVAHLSWGCPATRREKTKKGRKGGFYQLFTLGFSYEGSFLMLSFSTLIIDHKAARSTPESVVVHSWLSFSKSGQTPCHACLPLLTANTVQACGSGLYCRCLIGESHNRHLNPVSCR